MVNKDPTALETKFLTSGNNSEDIGNEKMNIVVGWVDIINSFVDPYFLKKYPDYKCIHKDELTDVLNGFNEAYNNTHYLMPDSTVTELNGNEKHADYKIIKQHYFSIEDRKKKLSVTRVHVKNPLLYKKVFDTHVITHNYGDWSSIPDLKQQSEVSIDIVICIFLNFS